MYRMISLAEILQGEEGDYPMHGGLDVPSCQIAQRISSVDSEASIKRLGPLPLVCLWVSDLKSGNWLTEEQSPRT